MAETGFFREARGVYWRDGRRERHRSGILIVSALIAAVSLLLPAVGAACPKVLMFDGVNVTERFDLQDARYWAHIGIDGFFVGRVLNDWTKSVGENEHSDVYRRLRSFQEIYASQGVAYNFLKIAGPYGPEPHFGWTSAERSAVVQRFRDGAHLARYAGLKGIAFDLEPYQRGLWEADPAIPNKAQLVFALGRDIGRAIFGEYPDATIIVIPEVLQYAGSRNYPNYALSADFFKGLVQTHFVRLVIATERSYITKFLGAIVADAATAHKRTLQQAGWSLSNVSFAFGLWPLGKTYTDKAPHETPQQFYQRLQIAFAAGQPYVWIYGHGSAWQTNGPYGSGAVDTQFPEFVQALEQVKAQCASNTLPLAKLPMRQDLWSLARPLR